MQPADLNRMLAQATGESVATIQRLGFELIDPQAPYPLDPDDNLSQRFSWDGVTD